MSKKANPAVIGAFVIGAVALVVLALVLWGSSALFERKHEYVCYFPGSVNGLARGAAVKYRGVEIGAVRDVRIRFRQAPDDTRIPVIIELWDGRLRDLGAHEPARETMERLVAGGLRARLASTSLVTGVMYVSFEEAPDTPIHRSELPGPGALPEIPTLPTQLDELTESLSQVVADLPGAIDSARRLTRTLDGDAVRAGKLVDEAQGAVAALRSTLSAAHGIVAPNAPLPVDLGAAVSNVDKAAIAIRDLAEFLRRNPHAIVAGTKPRPANP